MIRVVLDSNVIISAFLFGGKPARIIHLAEDGFIRPIYSLLLRDEVEGVLTEKFQWTRTRIALACGPLWAAGECVVPQTRVDACIDPDDDRVLECALEGRAHCIVSGDKHLLKMLHFEKIPILTPGAFLLRFAP